MGKYVWTGTLLSLGMALAGCQAARESEVRREMEDLQEAKQKAPEVANNLQKQVEQAKAKVVRLEEELAMARQGITKDVIEERKELKNALSRQGKQVNEEVQQAEQASRTYSQEAQQAGQRLQETQQQNKVEAEVRTETRVVPAEQQPEVTTQRETIPIERTRVIDRKAAGQKNEESRGAKETPAPMGQQRESQGAPTR